jgi:hypothetical protein
MNRFQQSNTMKLVKSAFLLLAGIVATGGATDIFGRLRRDNHVASTGDGTKRELWQNKFKKVTVKYDPTYQGGEGDGKDYPTCILTYSFESKGDSGDDEYTIVFEPDEIFEDGHKVKCQKKKHHPRGHVKLPVNNKVPNECAEWVGETVTHATVKWGLETWSKADSKRLDVVILVSGPPHAPPGTEEQAAMWQQGETFPATNGQTANMLSQGGVKPINVVCGAVQSVLAHPEDPDICFAGATNGGVWRTFSCTAAEPDWEPLTDEEESLSVGDMYFDEEDPNSNTIIVAVGTRSALLALGGPPIGMLYTQDALAKSPTWQVLDNSAGSVHFRENSMEFKSVFVRGDLMLAAAYLANLFICDNLGVFRSTDRGVTWTNVLKGVAHAIASDPNNPERFYATLDHTGVCGSPQPNGVFTSDDFGATWTFTSLQSSIPAGQLKNAKLSISADNSRVWSGLVRRGVVNSIAYSDNNGALWQEMDEVLLPAGGKSTGLNPGGQGEVHFSLLASPFNKDEIYVGGEAQSQKTAGLPWPNFIGATDFTGILFRGDASINPTNTIPSPQWEHMTNSDAVTAIPGGGTASNSGPHADSRDMEIRADGSILEGNDGGIVVRTDPETNQGDWFGVSGNMQVFETHNVAYEPLFGSVIFGNQDVATIAGTLGSRDTFTSIFKGDGNHCMIDYASDPDNLYFYYGDNNFLELRRTTVSKSTLVITSVVDIQPNMGAVRFGDFVSVGAMNPADQRVFAIGTGLFTSFYPSNGISITADRGNTFNTVQTGESGGITAMAWSQDGLYLYVASSEAITKCTWDAALEDLTCAPAGNVGAVVRSLAVDSNDSDVLYAVTTSTYISSRRRTPTFDDPAVFESTDRGATWTDISVTGSLLNTAASGGAAAFIGNDSVSTVVVGTSNGVLVPDGTESWNVLAKGLPKVPVLEMVYEPADDTLVAATFGRGVWFLDNATKAVALALSDEAVSVWSHSATRGTGGDTIDFSSFLTPQ